MGSDRQKGQQGEIRVQIVTDSGADLSLDLDQLAAFNIHIVPLIVTLDGETYREGIDIEPGEFYRLLAASSSLPKTSQPSAGDFAAVYKKLAEMGEGILSIHMSSGLSGTYNAALAGAELVPEARVTHVDTKTLSAAAGWQVEAAARAAGAGWETEEILALLKRIGDASDSIYTLKELKYLIHGGRISHMQGLIAAAFQIKPLIGVEKEHGTYVQLGRTRSFGKAVQGLVELIEKDHLPGSSLRVQVMYSNNPEGAELLRDRIDARFACDWLPIGPMSLVLGAHTGPSMVGVAYAPLSDFQNIP
jgi:DegV family protein with EDD domain